MFIDGKDHGETPLFRVALTPGKHQVKAVLGDGRKKQFTIDIKSGKWWGDDNIWTHEDPGVYLGPRANKVWKPVVCAIQGMCAGGGQYFVNECDIVICSDTATFFDPHVTHGMPCVYEPMFMLQRMPLQLSSMSLNSSHGGEISTFTQFKR
ncbi:MAG: enoyl-CoA hydratase/isomerase family protein [Akkermansiaceae bacterium]|nr:enoyl-CoA hydratase/isomerase family protein [Akkermansiaceae bacterium]